jgi:hypothetical protein
MGLKRSLVRSCFVRLYICVPQSQLLNQLVDFQIQQEGLVIGGDLSAITLIP